MTDHELQTLLRERVVADEPAFTLSVAPALAAGRRRVRARRIASGVSAAAVAALVAAAVPVLGDGGAPVEQPSPQVAAALERFDAAGFPRVLDTTLRETLGHDVPVGRARVTAYDSQLQVLPPRYRDKASAWQARASWTPTHWVGVDLTHSASESEGDVEEFCSSNLEAGYSLRCSVGSGPGGEVTITDVAALRVDHTWDDGSGDPSMMAVPDPGRVDPDQRWFARSVEARRGGVYVTVAQEVVKAPSLAAAERAFEVPVRTLTALAVHPDLVFPEPPLDEDGCAWVMPSKEYDVSCG